MAPGCSLGSAEQRRAEAVDRCHHRIGRVCQLPALRDDARWIGHGRAEEPELDEHRHRHLDVSEADVESREPASDPDGGHEREQEEGRHPHDREGEWRRGEGQPDERDGEGRAEVDERHAEWRERDQDAREVHALHEILARDDAVRGGEDSECDELPRKQRREGCQGVGSAGGVEVAQLPEEEREHTDQQQRLQDGPEHADRALLVADRQIPPGEEREQLARAEHLAQARGVAMHSGPRRVNHERRQLAEGRHTTGHVTSLRLRPSGARGSPPSASASGHRQELPAWISRPEARWPGTSRINCWP